MRLTQGRVARVSWVARGAAILAAVATVLGGILIAPVATAAPPAPAGVGDVAPMADLSQFQPGNIVSDAVFLDSGTMTAAQIQAFLEKQVPTCQSGYVCLKDWYDTSRSTSADAMCGAYSGGMRERASTIIYKVAQACGINPQVILVTLQKEQALVTHTWPSEWRYTIAMGQGCPDTAACDERYHGFFNQVYGGAWQFKRYANPPGTSQYFTWYAPGNTWNIQYNPNQSCGSSPVYVQNQATANLYYYTPYQPNAAALRAGYGEGDGCSAYGNRNFFNYFNDWFGSTVTAGGGASATSLDSGSHVLAVDTAGDLWAYPGNGRSSWMRPAKVGTGWGGFQGIYGIGDLDGDGHRDLLAVSGAGAVLLYPGDGGLGYRAPVTLPVDFSGAVRIAPAHDFDGDGVPDVFTVDAAGDLFLWRGDGFGGLRAGIRAGNGWGSMDLLIGTGDFDGDGRGDLVARSTDGRLHLASGNGRGGWLGVRAIGNGWQVMSGIVSPGDFTGDGRADLLARNASGAMLLYSGTGGGGLASQGQVGSGWQGMRLLSGAGALPGTKRVPQPGAGDVDGDGARDVVATTEAGQVLVYRGDGGGGWRGTLDAAASVPSGSRLVTLGDFDGDGLADLGRVAADGTFDLLAARGDGTYAEPRAIGNGWAEFTALVGGIDFDGDRRVDVIARTAGGALLLYRGNGAGGWLSGGASIGAGWSSMTAILHVGDFDGDGAGDLMARATDGTLWLYPTNGAGSWKSARQIGVGWSGFTALFGPGDFDSLGAPDVLARTSDGRLFLYGGNGSGGWASSYQIGQGWNALTQLG